ncbi:hypothetical protein C2E23DRAFT_889222 [Lenzites betulinus]|nr:hypothetical protein C2E23DRAFT_889222 [Lenzites betulinus]
MIVEALWRNLKRLVLHMYNRPPIDLALHAIVTKSLPPYRQTLKRAIKNPRLGRAAKLTHLQKDLKRSWERLEKVPIKGVYETDIKTWTCDCGSQKYHAHLLCKHLVQAVGHPPANWWTSILRYHIPPFYTVPIEGVVAPPPEHVDNYGWAERLHSAPSAIIVPQHQRIQASPSNHSGSESPVHIPEHEDGFQSSSSICSSPAKPPPTGPDGLYRVNAGGGAGFALEDDESVSMDEIERCLTSATNILRSQDNNPDLRFIQNATKSMYSMIKWACKLDRALALFQEHRQAGEGKALRKAIRSVRGVTEWIEAHTESGISSEEAVTITHESLKSLRADVIQWVAEAVEESLQAKLRPLIESELEDIFGKDGKSHGSEVPQVLQNAVHADMRILLGGLAKTRAVLMTARLYTTRIVQQNAEAHHLPPPLAANTTLIEIAVKGYFKSMKRKYLIDNGGPVVQERHVKKRKTVKNHARRQRLANIMRIGMEAFEVIFGEVRTVGLPSVVCTPCVSDAATSDGMAGSELRDEYRKKADVGVGSWELRTPLWRSRKLTRLYMVLAVLSRFDNGYDADEDGEDNDPDELDEEDVDEDEDEVDDNADDDEYDDDGGVLPWELPGQQQKAIPIVAPDDSIGSSHHEWCWTLQAECLQAGIAYTDRFSGRD